MAFALFSRMFKFDILWLDNDGWGEINVEEENNRFCQYNLINMQS